MALRGLQAAQEGRGIGIAEVRLGECQRVKGGGLLAAKPEGIEGLVGGHEEIAEIAEIER